MHQTYILLLDKAAGVGKLRPYHLDVRGQQWDLDVDVGIQRRDPIGRKSRLDDPVLFQSATTATNQLRTILRGEGHWLESLAIRLIFDDPAKTQGRSAELAIALSVATALPIPRRDDVSAVAATGEIDEEGRVLPVAGIPQKLSAYLDVAPRGAYAFYPRENQALIDQRLQARASARSVRLIPVGRLEEALEALGVPIRGVYLKSPYVGLSAFGFDDAGIYFGRETEAGALLSKLEQRTRDHSPSILVVGSSGTGKSSLVQAGLLPRWISARCSHRRHTVVRPDALTPPNLLKNLWRAWCTKTTLGDNHRLADYPVPRALGFRLSQLRPDLEWLLVLDQLEQIFSSAWKDPDRAALARELLDLIEHGIAVVATIRSDFLEAYIDSPLHDCFGDAAQYTLTKMSPTQLERIVRRPAEYARCRFEERDGLSVATQIQHDAATTTDAGTVLPLLQFTLTQLHQHRDAQNVYLWKHYEQMGGLAGSIGRVAEATFKPLSEQTKDSLPQLLWKLCEVRPENTERVIGRSARRADRNTEHWLADLEEAFIEARLLFCEGSNDTAKSRIGVIHEALLTHWERAVEFIARQRDALTFRTEVERDFSRWQAAEKRHKRDLLLPAGKRLEDARILLLDWHEELPPDLTQYIEASLDRASQSHARIKQLELWYREVWRAGDQLVVFEDAVLPKRCIKTNEPVTTDPITLKLVHYPTGLIWGMLPFLAPSGVGLIPWLAFYSWSKRTATITIYLSDKWKRRHRLTNRSKWGLTLGGTALAILAPIACQCWAPVWIGTFLMLSGVVIAATVANTVTPTRIEGRYVWLKGVNEGYLRNLPDWFARREFEPPQSGAQEKRKR